MEADLEHSQHPRAGDEARKTEEPSPKRARADMREEAEAEVAGRSEPPAAAAPPEAAAPPAAAAAAAAASPKSSKRPPASPATYKQTILPWSLNELDIVKWLKVRVDCGMLIPAFLTACHSAPAFSFHRTSTFTPKFPWAARGAAALKTKGHVVPSLASETATKNPETVWSATKHAAVRVSGENSKKMERKQSRMRHHFLLRTHSPGS